MDFALVLFCLCFGFGFFGGFFGVFLGGFCFVLFFEPETHLVVESDLELIV